MKFGDLLNNITKVREGGGPVDVKMYIEWGKALENIVDVSNISQVAGEDQEEQAWDVNSFNKSWRRRMRL